MRNYDGFRPGINIGSEDWDDLVAIQIANPDQFLVFYEGPGIHPDHPTDGCASQGVSICGHLSDCSTHNLPAYPSGPCDCKDRK